jgi:hypothetical protein
MKLKFGLLAVAAGLLVSGLPRESWAGGGDSEIVHPKQKRLEVDQEAWILLDGSMLSKFNAATPEKLSSPLAICGLLEGERLVAMDYLIDEGKLFALGETGQMYVIDPDHGTALRIGRRAGLPASTHWALNYDPASEAFRAIASEGFNIRFDAKTGAMLSSNPDGPLRADALLHYAKGDAHEGRSPSARALSFTYEEGPGDKELTTAYVLDGELGTLAMLGAKSSPEGGGENSQGTLSTVGSLGIGSFGSAILDIADDGGRAFAAIERGGLWGWYEIDLKTGAARRAGSFMPGAEIQGMALIP